MLTNHEISTLNLSPTKKDFVQIWSELLEVAQKLSERWDPTSTNESDPGIVLLKALTGIADKLNYNIDKNILEAYMPTAAQEESMRKLCDMMGYNIKYYRSATTSVRVQFTADPSEKSLSGTTLVLPKFTTILNADKDITYFTINENDCYLTEDIPYADVLCMEGQVVQCESINEHNIIGLAQLDSKNRYYLPETQIAENGIFIYNVASRPISTSAGETTSEYSIETGTAWSLTDNLNTQPALTRAFKFGFDSREGRPYVEFPEDVSRLIQDGIFIYYTRTSGLRGNISARTLSQIELPSDEAWQNYAPEDFTVFNETATVNGANIESISQAYSNFKKTVGTFDTLVTCRDYMNKIYSLMSSDNNPVVSNILVTDIRNDINKSITLCSCNEYGIYYLEKPLQDSANKDLISHFDLILYPYKTYNQVGTGADYITQSYNDSFKYDSDTAVRAAIIDGLEDTKTISHNIRVPSKNDIVGIKNYLRLDALIATSVRVSAIESATIIDNIKVALVRAFNARNLDFGEEIPFESILSVIEGADSRIKAVSLAEPTILTTFAVLEESAENVQTVHEYGIASTASNQIVDVTYNTDTAKSIYNKLTLRNILAGRVSLFDYEDTFQSELSERPYTVTKPLLIETADDDNIDTLYEKYSKATAASWPQYNDPGTDATQEDKDAAIAEHKLALINHINGIVANAKNLESIGAPYTSISVNSTSDAGYNWLHLYADTNGSYVTTPVVDTQYYLGCAWSSDETKDLETAYFTGTITAAHALDLATSRIGLEANAGKVQLEYANGTNDTLGYYLRFYEADGDTVKYLTLLDSNTGVTSLATTDKNQLSSTFKWDATLSTLTVAGNSQVKALGADTSTPSTVLPVDSTTLGYYWAKLYKYDASAAEGSQLTLISDPANIDTSLVYKLAVGNIDEKLYYVTGDFSSSGFGLTGSLENAASVYITGTNTIERYNLYIPDSISGNPNYFLISNSAENACSFTASKNVASIFVWNATCGTLAAQISIDSYGIGAKKLLKPASITLRTSGSTPQKVLGPEGGEMTVVFKRDSYGNVVDTAYFETIQPYEGIYPVPTSSGARAVTPSTSKKITKLSASCEMATSTLESGNLGISDLTLGTGEQIKFRAPNLITTKTYPAYINYNLQRANEVLSGQNGRAATVMSLRSFMWNSSANIAGSRWPTLFTKAQADEKLSRFTKVNENYCDPGSMIAVSIAEIFRTAGVIKYVEPGTSGRSDYITSADTFTTIVSGLAQDTVFYFLPLNPETLSYWDTLIIELNKVNPVIASGETCHIWRLSGISNSYVIGHHVTREWRKVLPHTPESMNTSNCPFDIGYVLTDAGEDPAPTYIKDGADYELRENERLYIQYTPSSTDTSSEANPEPITLVYGRGTIIKPIGFDLHDSDFTYRQGVSWKKQDVVFNDNGSSRKINLMTLGASEQIEIRELAQVKLAGPANIYKNFDNVDLETISPTETKSYILKDGEYIFYSDQHKMDAAYYGSGTEIKMSPGLRIPSAPKVDIADIFSEGLHKLPWQSMANLSKNKYITLTEYQYQTLVEGDTAVEVPLEDVGEYLGKAWKKCAISTSTPVKYKLNGSETVDSLPIMDITGYSWEASCQLALNVSDESPQTIRSDNKVRSKITLQFEDESEIDIIPVKTDLGLDTLLADNIQTFEAGGEHVHNTGIVAPIEIPVVVNELAFKTNLVCQAAEGDVSIKDSDTPLQIKVFSEAELEIDEVLPGSFIVPPEFEVTTAPPDETLAPVKRITATGAGVNVANSSLISVSVEGLAAGVSKLGDTSVQRIISEHPLTLNLDVPSNTFGIFSIYYDPAQVDRVSYPNLPPVPQRAYIEVAAEDAPHVSIYNNRTAWTTDHNVSDPDRWWQSSLNGFDCTLTDENLRSNNINLPAKPYTTRLCLKIGLNCIKVTKSCRIDLKALPNAGGSLLIDRLRLVKTNGATDFSGVNLNLLDYQALSVHPDDLNTSTPVKSAMPAADLLLHNIREIDTAKQFYYNAHIEDSLAIELNDTAAGQTKMSAPSVFYDVNNINNHFVLSELDINYLDTGLSIARSSKLS